MKRIKLITLAIALTVMCSQSYGAVISINLWDSSAGDADNNNVDAGETAGVVAIDGQHWNNIGFAHGNADHSLTQAVMDDQGNATAATFTSTLTSGWVSFSGAANAAPKNGDRDMMASYLSWDSSTDGDTPNDSGILTITGLGGGFTANGYNVYVYADGDNNARTYNITTDGVTLAVVDSATFTGTFNASGSDTDENYALFTDLTASSFTIDMNSVPGRGAVNGIQIVEIPEPATMAMVALGSLAMLRRKRNG